MPAAAKSNHRLLPWGPHTCLVVVIALAVVFLFVGIDSSGIWDPHELDRAELARRIAVQFFGAADLALTGAVNSMPTLSDLVAGELPFTSMALGFATLGLHEYAGRLPLALWALSGVVILYVFLQRLVAPRAGLYAAVALLTMPLYVVHARTMLGDIVTMVAAMWAFCGWMAALLERRSTLATMLWLLVGTAGLFAGYLSRGMLLGVAAPALGVGASWLLLAGSSIGGRLRWGTDPADNVPGEPWRRHRRMSALLGTTALLIAGLATMVGSRAVFQENWGQDEVSRMVGAAFASRPPVEATFDLGLRDLGHALFPWSAFLPFAFARLFLLPSQGGQERRMREIGIRAGLLLGSACFYFAYASMAPYVGALPYAGVGLLAAVIGVVIYDFEREAPPSGLVGAGTLILLAVLLRDMTTMLERSLSVYGVSGGSLPVSFESMGHRLMLVASLSFAVLFFFAWLDRPQFVIGSTAAWRVWFRERTTLYRERLHALSLAFEGNLAFGFLLLEAVLIGLAGTVFLGRYWGWVSVMAMPAQFAKFGLNAWWALPLVLLFSVVVFDLARAVVAFLIGALRLPRAAVVALAGLIAGGVLCLAYYPALARQLSPREVFDAYRQRHQADEPLGLLGFNLRVAPYYTDGEKVHALESSQDTMQWLATRSSEGLGQRRWLAVRSRDLPELNAAYRGRGLGNLPVLHARSSEIMLASNRLGSESNKNPLGNFVSSTVPDVQHPVRAMFEDKLEALGWDVRDENGKVVSSVVPGRSYQMCFFFRVHRPIRTHYKAFLHIDGYGRRHNGDREVLGGRYKMSYWRPGDIITDRYPLRLEPNFMPGQYRVLFGFFSGKQRFAVDEGKHDDNRVNGGVLRVR